MLSQLPPSSTNRKAVAVDGLSNQRLADKIRHRRDDSRARDRRLDTVRLGRQLVSKLPGRDAYLPHLLNTGTEALEMVVSHAYMVHLEALRAVHNEIRAIVSDIWLQAATGEDIELPEGKSLAGILDDLEQRNLGALESFQRHPILLAYQAESPVVGGGALGPRLRNACRNACEGVVEPRVVNLDRRGSDRIDSALEIHRCHFRVPRWVDGRIEVGVRSESLVFLCVVGPSESGEGICSLAQDAASSLVFRPKGLALAIEESRTGCPTGNGLYSFGRTPLAQSRPDYVLFSKLMAGWGAKIGAAMVRSDVLRTEYADDPLDACSDDFSVGVALSVLQSIGSDLDRPEAQLRRIPSS